MASLLRSTSHGNGIAVLADGDGRGFRKFARDQVGIDYLARDFEGINWYRRQVTPHEIEPVFHQGVQSALLWIPAIDGKRVSVEAPLAVTHKYIARAAGHYRDVWPHEKCAPFHGDLTLDNILFQKDKVRFFDWEHFDKDGVEWGLDLVYLALSGLYLPHIVSARKFRPDQYLDEVWYVLAGMGINAQMLTQPHRYLRDLFLQDQRFRTIVDVSPRKLFPMLLNEREAADGDAYFESLMLKFGADKSVN